MISRKNQTKYIQNKTKNEGIENACVCTTTYCLFTENKEAVTIKKLYWISVLVIMYQIFVISLYNPQFTFMKKKFKSPHICTFYCLWYFPQPQSLNIMFLLINNILLLSLLFRRKKYVNGQISNKYYLCFEHKKPYRIYLKNYLASLMYNISNCV